MTQLAARSPDGATSRSRNPGRAILSFERLTPDYAATGAAPSGLPAARWRVKANAPDTLHMPGVFTLIL
jgi:hypothetical protein